jgi:hypothetical protein
MRVDREAGDHPECTLVQSVGVVFEVDGESEAVPCST